MSYREGCRWCAAQGRKGSGYCFRHCADAEDGKHVVDFNCIWCGTTTGVSVNVSNLDWG